MFLDQNKKNRYTLVNPSFTLQKLGMMGYTFHRHVSMMTDLCYLTFLSNAKQGNQSWLQLPIIHRGFSSVDYK